MNELSPLGNDCLLKVKQIERRYKIPYFATQTAPVKHHIQVKQPTKEEKVILITANDWERRMSLNLQPGSTVNQSQQDPPLHSSQFMLPNLNISITHQENQQQDVEINKQ